MRRYICASNVKGVSYYGENQTNAADWKGNSRRLLMLISMPFAEDKGEEVEGSLGSLTNTAEMQCVQRRSFSRRCCRV